MSAAYIVLVGSEEKNGVLDPTILGFKTTHLRKAWLERGGQKALERWERNEGECYGGWPTYYFIGPGSALDPEEWLADQNKWAEEFDEAEG